MAIFDERHIELARKSGAPDPEGNARRAEEILALLRERRIDEARSRLDGITDPVLKNDLVHFIEFSATGLCILPRSIR